MKKHLTQKGLILSFALSILTCSFSDAQVISTVAGNGTAGLSGNGGQATAAKINMPRTMTFDAAGNMYIADYGNNCIRKVTTTGVISTIAGTGTSGFSGDGGPATAATLNGPKGVLVDGAGNIYIADAYNNRIRKINPSGIISTIAGNGAGGYSGDGGAATAAKLNAPERTVLDAAGNLYIADYYNNCIRKINTSGIITTIAGNGTAGFSGDGGPSTAAKLSSPVEVAIDAAGNLYISDYANNRVRKITTAGIISTVAGTGAAGFSGDGGQATAAQVKLPYGVSFDCGGNLFIADNGNNRVRKVTTAGVISTVAGIGTAGFSGDGGQATAAQLNSLTGVAFDASGNLYIGDYNNSRIRMVSQVGGSTAITVTSATICAGSSATLTAGGVSSYTWNTGSTGPGITVSPTVTTSYTVSGSSSECTGTATTSVIVELCTGIAQHSPTDAAFKLYPNPCAASITVAMTTESAYDLEVIDVTGRLVLSSKEFTGNYMLNTTSLNPGLYMLQVKTKAGLVSVGKFFKE